MQVFRTTRLVRRAILAAVAISAIPAEAQMFTLNGVREDDFRVTTFAQGLNYPIGMAELSDGSVLVAVSRGSSFFGSNSGQILRLADLDGDGVSDTETVVADSVPGGGLSALRVQGDLLFTTGQGRGKPITVYRLGENPTDRLTEIGQISITYPSGGWQHPHSALATRPTPGVPNSVDLFFQLGSKTNFDPTTATAELTSTIGISKTLQGDAIHMLTIADKGEAITATSLTQIATGLRNAAGMAVDPTTGDLYLQDNGIDGISIAIEPLSADELNIIPRDQIGGSLEDFGFPHRYNEYRTGQIVGIGGIDPVVAFHPLPIPDGAEAEGPNDIAFAPPGFPEGVNQGVFLGMHGQFSRGGQQNEENPLVYADPRTGEFFHFITSHEPSIGHLDGLLSTEDSLYVADVSSQGGFGSSASSSGKIYRIQGRPDRIECDFDSNGLCDVVDLDRLIAAQGTDELRFDLDQNGSVGSSDRDTWLTVAGERNQGTTYLQGDANLDGAVDAADLNALAVRWQQENISSWGLGDFTGDGRVDSFDLTIIGTNWLKGGQAESPNDALGRQPVPEPGSAWSLMVGLAAWVKWRSNRASRSY